MTAKKKPPKLRSISKAELKKILSDHKNWLESEGGQGQRADLSGVILHGAKLRGANLRKAILCGADLRSANLRKAKLSEADLCETNLDGALLGRANLFSAKLRLANLRGAELRRANLSAALLTGAEMSGVDLSKATLNSAELTWSNLNGACLFEASFRGADLDRANLNNVYLDGTDFTHAHVGWTNFGSIDLSKANGLETIRHTGPSTIGVDTIYKSKGEIPEIFLRGAGVPDSFITLIPSLITAMKPIQFYSCFISYSSLDQAFAERLHADLQAKGVRCWFAPEDMKIGDKIRPVIDQAIRVHEKLLLVLSKNSIGSDWVEKEVETAFDKENESGKIALFPIRLDEAVMESDEAWAADIRRTRHIGDFRKWKNHDQYQKAFDRLLRDLQAENPAQMTSE